jgi:hypothetical protein
MGMRFEKATQTVQLDRSAQTRVSTNPSVFAKELSFFVLTLVGFAGMLVLLMRAG